MGPEIHGSKLEYQTNFFSAGTIWRELIDLADLSLTHTTTPKSPDWILTTHGFLSYPCQKSICSPPDSRVSRPQRLLDLPVKDHQSTIKGRIFFSVPAFPLLITGEINLYLEL